MPETAAISIRVDPNLKKKVEARAKQDGRSLASLVKRMLTMMVSDKPPQYVLEPRPHNSKLGGPGVFMRIAEGMPGVFMSATAARLLAERLVRDAEAAKHLPPQD